MNSLGRTARAVAVTGATLISSALSTSLGLVACLNSGGVAVAQTATPNPQELGPVSKQQDDNAAGVTSIDLKPGDHWEYQVYDDITGEVKLTTKYTLNEISDGNLIVQINTVSPTGVTAGPILQIYDDRWNFKEDPVFKRNPGDPQTAIYLPLKVGTSWNSDFTTVRETPKFASHTTAKSNVLARETVIMKSGLSYDAYKIETSAVSVVSPSDGHTYEYKSDNWYAPAVNRYVKLIVEQRTDGHLLARTISYLIAYTRRKD